MNEIATGTATSQPPPRPLRPKRNDIANTNTVHPTVPAAHQPKIKKRTFPRFAPLHLPRLLLLTQSRAVLAKAAGPRCRSPTRTSDGPTPTRARLSTLGPVFPTRLSQRPIAKNLSGNPILPRLIRPISRNNNGRKTGNKRRRTTTTIITTIISMVLPALR